MLVHTRRREGEREREERKCERERDCMSGVKLMDLVV